MPVALRQIDTAWLAVGLKLLYRTAGPAGHPERKGNEVGGAGGKVIEGGLGSGELPEHVMHGAVAPHDDEAIRFANLFVFELPLRANENGIDQVPACIRQLLKGVSELAGFTPAGTRIGNDGEPHLLCFYRVFAWVGDTPQPPDRVL